MSLASCLLTVCPAPECFERSWYIECVTFAVAAGTSCTWCVECAPELFCHHWPEWSPLSSQSFPPFYNIVRECLLTSQVKTGGFLILEKHILILNWKSVFKGGSDSQGFPGGTSGKESACQCRRCKRRGFDPWVRTNPVEEGTATHSSILSWRIPWTEEPGRLQSIGSQSQTWLNWLSMHACRFIAGGEPKLLSRIYYPF